MNLLNPDQSETADAPQNSTVFVLRVSLKFGANMEAHATMPSALASLYEYVAQEWDDGITEQYGALKNLTPQEAIDAYFDCWGEGLDPEYYELQALPVTRIEA